MRQPARTFCEPQLQPRAVPRSRPLAASGAPSKLDKLFALTGVKTREVHQPWTAVSADDKARLWGGLRDVIAERVGERGEFPLGNDLFYPSFTRSVGAYRHTPRCRSSVDRSCPWCVAYRCYPCQIWSWRRQRLMWPAQSTAYSLQGMRRLPRSMPSATRWACRWMWRHRRVLARLSVACLPLVRVDE